MFGTVRNTVAQAQLQFSGQIENLAYGHQISAETRFMRSLRAALRYEFAKYL